jgi:hypothetical protein
MNLRFFLKGIKNIFFSPDNIWETSKSGEAPARMVRNSFLFPLALMVAVSALFGSLLFTNAELLPVFSILFSIKCLAVILIAVYSTSYILVEITYPLDLGRDFSNSFRMVVFSVTPFLLCQVLSRLFESLLFVNVISFYGLYIFWIGAGKTLNPPKYKKMPLLIATVIAFCGIYITTDLILKMITERFYFAFFS